MFLYIIFAFIKTCLDFYIIFLFILDIIRLAQYNLLM